MAFMRLQKMIGALCGLMIAGTLQGGDVGQLSWMSGCWAMSAGPMVIEEQWAKPLGGMMMGLARTSKQGRVVFHEFMRITTSGADVVYTPRIGSPEKPVPFKLIKQSADEVVFENPTHDFPQRILYRKKAEGLFARIEGVDKGKERGEDFPMKRVPCE